MVNPQPLFLKNADLTPLAFLSHSLNWSFSLLNLDS